MPTPTPTPTGTVRAYGGAPTLAQFSFSNDYLGIVAQGFGTRGGFYAPGFAGSIDPVANAAADYSALVKTVSAIDQATSNLVQYSAPAAARVVTPATTLLRYGDQARVKRQLGLESGIDLLTFDAVAELQSSDGTQRQRAQAVLVANLNAQAIALALAYIEVGPNPFQGDLPALDYLGNLLSRAPDRLILNEGDLTAVLQEANSFYTRGLRPAVVTAAARLLATYAQAAGNEVVNERTATQLNAAAYGFVLPELKRLFAQNSDAAAAAVSAITSPQIRTETVLFQEVPPSNSTGLLFTALDFYRTAPGTALTLQTAFVATARYAQPDYIPSFNDYYVGRDVATNRYRFFSPPVLRSVAVPTTNASQIGATLQPNGQVKVEPAAGFRGVTWFDYVVEANNETRVGRAFVIVK